MIFLMYATPTFQRFNICESFETNVTKAVGIKFILAAVLLLNENCSSVCFANYIDY